jgi:hypothetical protein
MIDPIAMIGNAFEGMQGLVASTMNANTPETLLQSASDMLDLSALEADSQNFSAQLLYAQVSIQFGYQTEATTQTSASASPFDFSSAATAQRIFEFSISLFGVYQAQNPDESAEAALANFEQIVRDAIDEGFNQARGILEELGRLDDSTSQFVDETYSILQQLLDAYFNNKNGEESSAPATPEILQFQLQASYSYLGIEMTRTAAAEQTSAAGDSTQTDFVRFEARSLYLSLEYTRGAAESAFQAVA